MTNSDDTSVSSDDDLGGVPFDDEFEFDDEVLRGGPLRDSPASLQSRSIGYPGATPVGMVELKNFVVGRWGGTSAGILTRPPRPVRGGSAPSLHNWGMAFDWRYAELPGGRAIGLEVIDFLVASAERLGIQAIHDYAGGKYWKNHKGWMEGTPSSSTGMGQAWAQWLHFERTWDQANDPTPVGQLLGAATPPPKPRAEPSGEPAGQKAGASKSPSGAGTGSTAAPASLLPIGPLRLGSEGADVAIVQDYLRFTAFAGFTKSDGVFGQRTDEAVRAAQTRFEELGLNGGPVDGVWGKKSAGAAEEFLRRGGK